MSRTAPNKDAKEQTNYPNRSGQYCETPCLHRLLEIADNRFFYIAGAVAMVYFWPRNHADIYRCTCSIYDRLGFYAEIQIIFGTVQYNTCSVRVHQTEG